MLELDYEVTVIDLMIYGENVLDNHKKLNKIKGDIRNINLWINSKAYNFLENIHQFWLLLLVDLVIAKTEYLPNKK